MAIARRSQHPGEDLVPQPCPCPWWRKAGQAGPLTSCLCRWTQDGVLVGCLEGSPLRSGRSVWSAPELDFFHGSCQVPTGGVTPGRPRPQPGTQLGHSGPRCLGAGEGRGSRLGEMSFISSLRQVGLCLFHNTGLRTRNSKITEGENKQFPAPRPWRHPPCAWLMGSWLGLRTLGARGAQSRSVAATPALRAVSGAASGPAPPAAAAAAPRSWS